VTRENPWNIGRSRESTYVSLEYVTRDKYKDNGEQIIVLGLQKSVSKIRSLPSSQKEAFVSSFVKDANNRRSIK
jgi:hypothetical protein